MTHDHDRFETALTRALAGYADRAPVEVDAVAMSTALAGTRGRVSGPATRWTARRWFVPVLIGLLVALLGVALVAGGIANRLPSILRHPATADDLLFLMDMRRDPQDHVCADVRRIAVASGARRQVIGCADQVEFTHDGSRAAVGGLTGLTIVDTHDGSQIADLPTGVWTRPVGWSPSGRWIQMAECTPLPADRCTLVIVAADGSTRNEIPNTTGGGYSPAGWAPDESRLYTSQGLADPDGSNVRPVPVGDPIANLGNVDNLENWARSPSGTEDSVAYTQDHGVWLRTRSNPRGRLLAAIPDGHAVRTLAWSLDGRTLAAIESVAPVDILTAPLAVTLDTLQLIDVATGASQVLEAPRLQHRQRDGFEVAWSPDGRRLAITMGNGQASGNDRYSNSFDTVILPVDGSAPAVVLQDARGAAWSLDSRSLAYLATTGSTLRGDGEPWPSAALMVVDADGSAASTIVGPAEIVMPLSGEPSAWFLWAAPD